jgi:hypothetical protein
MVSSIFCRLECSVLIGILRCCQDTMVGPFLSCYSPGKLVLVCFQVGWGIELRFSDGVFCLLFFWCLLRYFW